MQPSKDLPPTTNFIPMKFPIEVPVPLALGGEGRQSIPINDRPFILQKITHQIIVGTLSEDPAVTPMFYQDGLYTIDWSLFSQARFFKGVPPLADIGFGSVRTGIWIPLPAPVTMPGNETIEVIIRNMIARQADYHVQVIFHGIQMLGSMTQARPTG
jgi:hypothetical protein